MVDGGKDRLCFGKDGRDIKQSGFIKTNLLLYSILKGLGT